MCLRIVSFYQPHANAGPYTVYKPHLQHYEQHNINNNNNNNNNDPIYNFDNEPSTLIINWMDAGDQILIMIDTNEDFQRTLLAHFDIL